MKLLIILAEIDRADAKKAAALAHDINDVLENFIQLPELEIIKGFQFKD